MFAVYHCRPNLSKYINDVAYERKSWNNVDFLECCISLLCVTVMSEIRELYHARGVQILVFVRRGKLLEFGQNTKDIVPKFYEFTNNWLQFENMGENITLTGEGFLITENVASWFHDFWLMLRKFRVLSFRDTRNTIVVLPIKLRLCTSHPHLFLPLSPAVAFPCLRCKVVLLRPL